ncbi:chemotaxis response regulator protein-glutamate methylesterase [Burkholderia stagnalis]|uniref:Protein-glutamate methylesterase/protein-glutamine glutaminase n=4 Tax=Burkholderia stagnalis TaxID=1503054 RepID=A0A107ZYB8_9BURK|nr:chemotaxis response regulator protein-glutamate methylesterase [Burkholderia stagnalis]KVM80080.1 chemotaxis response regulator protein-glutamate methylesterase [Burkholderia stagnalis]KVN11690.1 chemotaxis response regulator protein-glutamate methylesterase [Burkholderia stagnalis]KVZ02654.1 chemotaxis response regulator protein-glutamate methylesterase [Burkholderia stagnalis]KWA53769.1 chemotaxis response regulator protein-glutamate methylesterase [Burkholderia stagnalis]KWA58883.1 chemo
MNIGIVNDLPLAVEAMRRAIARRADHRVLWVATDGAQAVEFCAAQPPDVVLMDLIMPKFDGVEATRRIMASGRPCAILIVTSSIGANAWRVYEAMGAGALDAVDTPRLGQGANGDTTQLLLAKIDQIGRLLERPASGARPAGAAARGDGGPLVAIGASAGGPTALATILGSLPADFGASIVIVQHVDQAFADGMAQWLDGQTPLTVRIAHEGDRPQPSVALLAATNDHLRLARDGTLGYTRDPAETPYRPSVDVFFNSVTEHWPGDVIGVLLTGMGRDGAIGLKAMRMKGYHTIAQDQATSAVYGMPKAAATLGAARAILPLERIAGELAALARI